MYDPILTKSFSHYDQKRLVYFAAILCLSMGLSICIVFKPMFNHLSYVENTVNLQVLSINAPKGMVRIKDDDATILEPKVNIETKQEKHPICTTSEPLSDYCEINGDIRIEGNSSTIFIVISNSSNINLEIRNETTRTIQPYARKGNFGAMNNVKKWTIKLVVQEDHYNNNNTIPKCSSNQSNIPAILFSTGGFTGNLFHDFSDLIVPLYSTSQRFNGEVQFLATDYARWWISKYKMILSKLSKHGIVAIDQENETRCYSNVVVGLKTHKELIIDQSRFVYGSSMKKFRQFLRKTYGLERSTAVKLRRKGSGLIRPRLMIISRSRTRRFLNEDKITRMAKKLGYDVTVAETNVSSNMSNFANMVNSCDVLMGIHGAGLTNMVFLPENGVLIQVIPLGAIDGFARTDFGEPAKDMKINYLEYKIKVKESSLVDKFPKNHAVFTDPLSFHRKGWMEMRSIYLDQQDVRIDLRRFRSTLVRAMKLLRHSES